MKRTKEKNAFMLQMLLYQWKSQNRCSHKNCHFKSILHYI